ncbi:DUF6479 family protein [Streptomyces virginiae]|uniref:DUF6479 family protein n=1 Tax=Streptomyces virginiae TaxID=1961 RepID=UPI0036BB77A0
MLVCPKRSRPASLFLVFAGVVLVILLIGGFWYGLRRRREVTPSPTVSRRAGSIEGGRCRTVRVGLPGQAPVR